MTDLLAQLDAIPLLLDEDQFDYQPSAWIAWLVRANGSIIRCPMSGARQPDVVTYPWNGETLTFQRTDCVDESAAIYEECDEYEGA